MNDADQQDPDNERQPIWSVPSKKATLFFAMFTIMNMVGMAYFAWYEIFVNDQDSFHETIMNIVLNYVAVFVCSAGVSITTTEVVVVIGSYLQEYVFKPRRERIRAEGHKEGREEGIDEGIAIGEARAKAREKEAQDWNRRRLEAEARGEPFDEPFPMDNQPPSTNGADSEDESA